MVVLIFLVITNFFRMTHYSNTRLGVLSEWTRQLISVLSEKTIEVGDPIRM